VQHVSDLHPIPTKTTACVEVYTPNLRRLTIGDEKKNKKDRRRRNHRAKI